MQRRFDHTEFESHNSTICIQLKTLLSSRQTTLYGRQYTYQWHKQYGMPVVQDRMFTILKELHSICVASRRIHLGSRPCGAYLVPGPNFVWSIHGHHKLNMYGIEIYAGIDAFSRYVLHNSLFLIVYLFHILVKYVILCCLLQASYTSMSPKFSFLACTVTLRLHSTWLFTNVSHLSRKLPLHTTKTLCLWVKFCPYAIAVGLTNRILLWVGSCLAPFSSLIWYPYSPTTCNGITCVNATGSVYTAKRLCIIPELRYL